MWIEVRHGNSILHDSTKFYYRKGKKCKLNLTDFFCKIIGDHVALRIKAQMVHKRWSA